MDLFTIWLRNDIFLRSATLPSDGSISDNLGAVSNTFRGIFNVLLQKNVSATKNTVVL